MQKAIIAVLVFFLISACSKKDIDSKTNEQIMSPGYAKISATVVEINSILDSNKSKPCGNTNCYAKVRIDSVLGYGSAFGEPLILGSTITLKFMYTLEPTTKESFPSLEEQLPGLNIGSKFTGNIQTANSSYSEDIDSSKGLYRIFRYQIVN